MGWGGIKRADLSTAKVDVKEMERATTVVESRDEHLARGVKGVHSRAWRNRNPGNMRIRSTKAPVDHVAVDNAPGGPFGIYASEKDGWADLAARVIQLADGGKNTVASIIAIWAPPEDNNDTNAYINGVAAKMGVGIHSKIDPRDMKTALAISDAIRRHEGLPNDPAWDEAQRRAGLLLGGVRE